MAACSASLFAQLPTAGNCTVFPANNVWNARVDSLPVDPNSAAYVQTMGATAPLHPDFGAGGGFEFDLVPSNQPKYTVSFYYNGDPGPYPIPDPPPIEGGVNATGDRHAIMIDDNNCILYELFNLTGSPGAWSAGSGAIWSLNSNALRPAGWTSADAAGLPIFPGLIRYSEVMSGHINHALRFTATPTRDAFIWPARHEASSYSGSQYPPMGQRFRLKSSVDISKFPANVQVILTALKEYGMFLADNGTSWHLAGVGNPLWNDTEMHTLTQLNGSDFEAVDESSLMVDPNSAEVNTGSTANTTIPTGWVSIVSKNSGKCLDMTGGSKATFAGDAAQQWACLNGTNQAFQLTPVSGGYKVTVQLSGMQLDMRGGPAATSDGVRLQQWPYWGGSNEIFKIEAASNGYFTIRPVSSGLCLEVSGSSLGNGAAIEQNACTGGANQQWEFLSAQ